ncbi:hypothetical protein SDC9_68907 [bioreactor metagenome]|uniref:Fumarylacetoacetase-like C-terminal domain-containing protein n=1 Tax=bioreactor metagenome TaxID=1076179 RepID=A0A644Y1Q3_9ZZZZ
MTNQVQTVVQALRRARESQQQQDANAPGCALASIEDAYAVQAAMGRELHWWADGAPRYWKTGAASAESLQTSAPLPDAGVWNGPVDAHSWPMHSRGVESEIAFRLGASVTHEQALSLDVAAARGLVDAMTVAIELVDFRWTQGMAAPDLLKLADLQSHGALVLGHWVPYAERDWAAQVCRTFIGQQPEVTRQDTHSLGDPTLVLPRWLRHATAYFGILPAGAVVTTGTWVGLLHAQRGDHVRVQFDGVGEVGVQL